MNRFLTAFCLLGVCGTLVAQEAQPTGPVVTAKDDQPVEASSKERSDETGGRWYLAPGAGAMMIHRANKPQPGSNLRGVAPYVTLRLGYDFADSPFSLEGAAMFGTTNNKSGDGCVLGANIDGLWHFDRYARLDPFLAAGVGAFGGNHTPFWQDGDAASLFWDVGFGAMFHLDEHWSLRGDYRFHAAIDDKWMSFSTADISLMYTFGGSKDESAENLAPVGPIEPGAQKYDDASEHVAIVKDVTPIGAQDEMHLELHVQYAKDTAIIDASNYAALDELLRIIRAAIAANPAVYVTLDGHADQQHGSDHAYNQRLSEDRAKSIKTYLTMNGIDAGKLKASGHSFDQPKDPVDLENGTPSNRRTDVVIQGVDEATREKIRGNQ
ncbi:MAG: OmpA family protein [Kiritimatiellia bacterium]